MYSSSFQSKSTLGLTDVDGARSVARRLFDTYDKGRKGQISQVDCVPMIVEAYKSFNQYFSPSNQDIQSYFRVLDRNGDGSVSYDDIENLCLRYLCPSTQIVTRLENTYQPSRTEVTKKTTRRFSAELEAKLDVARRLFNKFDSDKSGELDESEVLGLLRETYIQMGMPNVKITEEDVKVWMEMNDSNRDGKVSLSEYETVVLRSLEKAGFKIEGSQISLN